MVLTLVHPRPTRDYVHVCHCGGLRMLLTWRALQELVDHCAKQGKPEVVEAAVTHMDVSSLDLNQVGPSVACTPC